MKSLLVSLGSQLLRQAIATQAQRGESLLAAFLPGAAPAPRPAPMPDFAYLTRTAKSYGKLIAYGAVATLFLCMGLMVSIVAAAQSMDLFGFFVAGTLFYSGLLVALVSTLVLLRCVTKARRISFSWEQFYEGTELMARHQEAVANAIMESPVARDSMSAAVITPVSDPYAAPTARSASERIAS